MPLVQAHPPITPQPHPGQSCLGLQRVPSPTWSCLCLSVSPSPTRGARGLITQAQSPARHASDISERQVSRYITS